MLLVKVGLVLLSIMSFIGSYIMWFTTIFQNYILSQLVLRNNSDAFNLWKDPYYKILYKVHIFNYTNVDDYRNKKSDKLHVKDIGPYTYEEVLKRIDISFGEDNKISYRENRILTFKPDLSKGYENDSVYVPNIPAISVAGYFKNQSYFWRSALSAALTGINEDSFVALSASSIITGYRNSIVDISKTFIMPDIPEKTGMLLTRLGVTSYKLTINSGEKDINRLGILEEFNGNRLFDSRLDETCGSCDLGVPTMQLINAIELHQNRTGSYFMPQAAAICVESSTGTYFPINSVKLKQPLRYLLPEVCRRMKVVFSKETTILDGVPVYEYSSPANKFSYSKDHPENICYCSINNDQCPPDGVLDISYCNFDSPVFSSSPHFYGGDPSLVKHFEGLHPEKNAFNSILTVHPTLGFVMTIRELYQINIKIQKVEGISQFDMFEDGMILPIGWIDFVIDEETMAPENKQAILMLSYTVPLIEQLLKYGCLLLVMVCLGCLIGIEIKGGSSKKYLTYKIISISNRHNKN